MRSVQLQLGPVENAGARRNESHVWVWVAAILGRVAVRRPEDICQDFDCSLNIFTVCADAAWPSSAAHVKMLSAASMEATTSTERRSSAAGMSERPGAEGAV